jgi:hypothetical protein
MINLVSKTVKMNSDTFAPELEVTIRLPLEPIQNGVVIDPNFDKHVGRELLELLKSN